MNPDLHDLADRVTDEESFIDFLHALADDRADEVEKEKASPPDPWGPGANGWQNRTIEAFLGAAAAWGAESADGLRFYTKPDNPWTRCANILLMGKLYE